MVPLEEARATVAMAMETMEAVVLVVTRVAKAAVEAETPSHQEVWMADSWVTACLAEVQATTAMKAVGAAATLRVADSAAAGRRQDRKPALGR